MLTDRRVQTLLGALTDITMTNYNASTTVTGAPGFYGNGTGGPPDYFEQLNRVQAIVVPVIFAVIFIVGVIGNGTTICIIFYY